MEALKVKILLFKFFGFDLLERDLRGILGFLQNILKKIYFYSKNNRMFLPTQMHRRRSGGFLGADWTTFEWKCEFACVRLDLGDLS